MDRHSSDEIESRMMGRDYRHIPDKLNMAWYLCDRWVDEGKGEETAILFEGEEVSWQRLFTRVNRFGNGLRSSGVSRGDRVLIRSFNSFDYVSCLLSCWKIGAVAMPLSTLLNTREVSRVVKLCSPRILFSTSDSLSPFRKKDVDMGNIETAVCLDDDPEKDEILLKDFLGGNELDCEVMDKDEHAFIISTSGSTGDPKCAVHGHRWLVASMDPVSKIHLNLKRSDVSYGTMEFSYMHGLADVLCATLYAGARLVIRGGRFEPSSTYKTMLDYGVSIFVSVPTAYRMLLAHPKRISLPKLRLCASAGEPLPRSTFDEWFNRFKTPILDGLGQTEPNLFIANRAWLPIKPGSMGRPLPGFDVSLVAENGEMAAVGEVGEICIRANDPALFVDYMGNHEIMDSVITGGWYHTKDLAYRDEDDYWWYISRRDDMIKSRAYLISPAEIEYAIMELPEVMLAAVIGVPDQLIGQKVKAFVTPKSDPDDPIRLAKLIARHVRSELAPFKSPKIVEFLKEMPKTPSGKISRRTLRNVLRIGIEYQV